MSWNGHDGAGSVISKYVIRGPYRQFLTVDWVYGESSKIDAALGSIGCEPLDVICLFGLFQKVLELNANLRRSFGGKLRCQIRICCHHHKCCTIQSVGACGVNLYWVFSSFNLKLDLCTVGSSNPIALHGKHLCRPCSLKSVQVI